MGVAQVGVERAKEGDQAGEGRGKAAGVWVQAGEGRARAGEGSETQEGVQEGEGWVGEGAAKAIRVGGEVRGGWAAAAAPRAATGLPQKAPSPALAPAPKHPLARGQEGEPASRRLGALRLAAASVGQELVQWLVSLLVGQQPGPLSAVGQGD